jgi:hypothetical protein
LSPPHPATPSSTRSRALLTASLIATSPLGACVNSCPAGGWETGSGAKAPDIVIDTEPMDAGVVWVGKRQELWVEYSNVGRSDLVISVLELNSTDGPFQLAAGLPEPLPFGSVNWIGLSYQPISAGRHQDSLTIRCNDPEQAVVSIALRGLGME